MPKARRPPGPSRAIQLVGRNRLLVTKADHLDRLQLVTADGAVPITIEVTSEGIAVKIDGPDLSLRSSGALSLSARKLVLEGTDEVEIACGGDLKLRAADELRAEAGRQTLRAAAGSIDVKASDDVKLSGERVMVNCDETIDRYYRESALETGASATEPSRMLTNKQD